MYGPDGRPFHSWRVLILPYIEQQELYKQFRLDEPWDSPHNIRLLDRMPSTYALPKRKLALLPPHHTVCHVFVGKNTPFHGPRGWSLKHFPDGTSNTILVIEGGEPVPWTKPEEISYDRAGPLPHIRGYFKHGIRLVAADGSNRHIRYDISEPTLRSAIEWDDGKVLGADW